MVPFLFLTCFILIAMAFFLIILLFQKSSRIEEIEKKQKQLTDDIEQLLTGFVLEIQEENETFLTKLQKNATEQTINEDKSMKEDSLLQEHVIAKALEIQGVKDSSPTSIPPINLQSLSFEDQVLYLKQEGLSTEEIAQKLNKGKTEIELLLKFRQK